MDTDRPRREVHDPGDFLGPLAQFDKIGNLYFRRGESNKNFRILCGERRGQFYDVGPNDIDQPLLLLGLYTFLQSIEKRSNQQGGV